MSEGGYTLTEVLVALAILGLGIGGLTQGVKVFAGAQRIVGKRLDDDQDRRRLTAALQSLLEGAGPFQSDDVKTFSGSSTGFQFACAARRPCSAVLTANTSSEVLTLTNSAGDRHLVVPVRLAGFLYQGARSARTSWPPTGDTVQTLQSVSLVDTTTGAPIASARLWVEQQPNCQFDAIAKSCRKAQS